MKVPRIKSITEAFSIQPITITVKDPDKRCPVAPEDDIKEILSTWNQEQTRIYVGFDFDNNKKFEYLTNSVNVHYF